MRQRTLTLVLFLISLASGPKAQALEMGNVYFSPHFGVAQYDSTLPEDRLSYREDSDSLYRLSIGYTLNDRWDAELYYQSLGEGALTPSGSIEYSSFGLDALFYFYQGLPHRGVDSLLLYGRLGGAYIERDQTPDLELESEFAASFGLGAEYHLTQGFGLRLEAGAQDADIQQLSLGFVKRFGAMAKSHTTPTASEAIPRPTIPSAIEQADAPAPPAPALEDIPVLSSSTPEPTAPPRTREGDFFVYGQAQLSTQGKQYLDTWVAQAKAGRGAIEVHAYSADAASPRANLLLSLDRSYEAVRYLTQQGIVRHRLSPIGHGEKLQRGNNRLELRWAP